MRRSTSYGTRGVVARSAALWAGLAVLVVGAQPAPAWADSSSPGLVVHSQAPVRDADQERSRTEELDASASDGVGDPEPKETAPVVWWVVAGGGATVTSESFVLTGTVSQTAAGAETTSGAMSLTGGFWAGAHPPGPDRAPSPRRPSGRQAP